MHYLEPREEQGDDVENKTHKYNELIEWNTMRCASLTLLFVQSVFHKVVGWDMHLTITNSSSLLNFLSFVAHHRYVKKQMVNQVSCSWRPLSVSLLT